jgi:hypothetical protein
MPPHVSRRLRRSFVLIASLLSVGASALAAVPAQADVVSVSACDSSALTQAFRPWADPAYYKLAPAGDFEGSLSGWTLSGGAAKVSGSEPYGATGSVGSSSLSLPAGASAVSPLTCVNAAYPTFRFFGRAHGLASTVLVQVLYTDPTLGPVTIPVGVAVLGGSWQPSLQMLTGSAIAGLQSGGTAQIALRFTALTGNSQIDDVYVDPFRM